MKLILTTQCHLNENSSKRPKVLITELLRVFGWETDDEIRKLFADVDTDAENKYIRSNIGKRFY
jgi:DNA-directed RNA polymerase beta subunit